MRHALTLYDLGGKKVTVVTVESEVTPLVVTFQSRVFLRCDGPELDSRQPYYEVVPYGIS